MSRPLVIALDLDEVLFPFARHYLTWRHAVGMTPFAIESMERYDFSAAVGEGDETATDSFIADPWTWEQTPVPGSVEAVHALMDAGHRVVLVTHRYQTQAHGTWQWLNRWCPGVTEVVFGRVARGDSGQSKAALCELLRADLLIDDLAAHLDGLGTSTRGVVFGTYPWNAASEHPWRLNEWDFDALEELVNEQLARVNG
jgi:5' nucleotidase, deoxy (Pyrimidine), cytosolic type C protein (NT5C)